MGKFFSGIRLRLTEMTRQPLTFATLIFLPPAVIEMYGIAVASFPRLPSLGADPATVGRMTGTLFSVAFLAGLIGLFQIISARKGDERLALAGYPRRIMLASRLVTMIIVSLAGAIVAFFVFNLRVGVSAPLLAFAGLVLAGLVYGLLGIIIGTLLPRPLEGSIVLVFMADLDNALSSSLFPLEASVSVPVIGKLSIQDVVPLYHPHELFVASVLKGELAADHLFPILGWLGGLLVVAFFAYEHSTGNGWTGLLPGWSG